MDISRTKSRAITTVVGLLVAFAVAVAGLALPGAPQADAAGPEYDGPVTQATGPAFFGPAPNPFPYCENPTYFDPFPENVSPIGRIDPTGTPNASVTTNGVTMTFEITAEGNPGTQYPGFFPAPDGEGGDGDQPKGVEMASDDEASIRLSEPLFYTQWVFTDVDRANEGFFVSPQWSGDVGQLAIFSGDEFFEFDGTTATTAAFNDTDRAGQPSEALAGRVQVDVLGATTGIDLVRDTGGGQSGFAIGGGCEPLGVAKEVTSGPTWNGSSFDVTYTIRVRNNLPSGATIAADVDAALAAAANGIVTGTPEGIVMEDVTLSDLLVNDAFSEVVIVSNENVSGNVTMNPAYNGDTDVDLLAAGETIPAETNEEFVLTLQYVPAPAGALGADCAGPYQLENQALAGGTADGVPVLDQSDEGANPDPGDNNGGGEVDDPTIVTFDCPPQILTPNLDIVKTVLPGPAADCPSFAAGVQGEGPALEAQIGDTITYCITVINNGEGEATDVVIADAQAPGTFDGNVGTLTSGQEATRSFDVVVTADTPVTNVASATGNGPEGPLPEVDDPTIIEIPGAPALDIVKTVLAGPAAECPSFADGVKGEGPALDVVLGDTITYCITVINTGDSPATDVVITDAQAPATFDGNVGTLAAGDEATRSFDIVVGTATPTTNTASATGNGPEGPLPEVDDPTIFELPDLTPAISLSKTVLAGADADCSTAVEGEDEFYVGETGDAITWCFVVTNTGDVPLVNVSFDDAPAGIAGLDLLAAAGLDVLEIGASITFDEPGTIPEDGVDNVASVSGEAADPDGNPIPGLDPVDDENTASVNEAELQIAKTVLPGADADCANSVEQATVNQGTIVTYCFEVSNTGGVPMLATEVVDVTLGVTVPIPEAQQIIAPGDSVTVSLSAVAESDLRNVASVLGTPVDEDGNPIPDAPTFNPEDPAEVDTLLADLSLVKSNGGFQRALVGNIINYTLVVSNAGPDAAVGVQIVDTLPEGLRLIKLPENSDWTCAADGQVMTCDRTSPLEANSSDELVYRVQVLATAPVGEPLVNTATATSDTTDPDDTDNTDDETVTVVVPPPPPDETFPIVTITPPDEPLPVVEDPPAPPLAVTGVSNGWLVFTSAAMTAAGAVLVVGGRRRRDDLLA